MEYLIKLRKENRAKDELLGKSIPPAYDIPAYDNPSYSAASSMPAAPSSTTSSMPAAPSSSASKFLEVNAAETPLKYLTLGDRIVAKGFYSGSTEAFSINLSTDRERFGFHIALRPPTQLVYNHQRGGGWQTEIRDEYTQFKTNSEFTVEVRADLTEFRVFVNGVEKRSFPFKARNLTLAQFRSVWFVHDLTGNQFCAIKVPSALPAFTDYIPTHHKLNRPLKQGDRIKLWGKFAKGTIKFNVNLTRSQNRHNFFHLDFRPSKTIVMNTSFETGWMTEIRDTYKPLKDQEVFEVVIFCDVGCFRAYLNGVEIKQFPYRDDLDKIDQVEVVHGSNGNGWIHLDMPQ